MIIEKTNMHDIDTFMFFKWAFKSAAAAIIVNHTFDFIMAVFQVAQTMVQRLSLIHISEPTRQAEISYAVFCLKKKTVLTY